MRKRYLLSAAVGVLALAFAAVAIASPQFKQTAKIKYTTNKGKKAAGINADLEASDPGASPAGNLPAATKVVIKFKGSKVNTKAGKRCKLPKTSAASCPAKTRIDKPGSGSADANVVGTDPSTGKTIVTGPIHTTVKAYLHTGGIYFVVQSAALGTTVVLDASLTKKGKLTTNVKRDVPTLPGGNKLVLTSFKVKIKKVTSGHGRKRKLLLRTPKCGKSKHFTITSKFNYDDGSSKTVRSKQKCRK